MEQNNDECDTMAPIDVIIVNLITNIFFIPSLGYKYFNYRCSNINGIYHKKSFMEFYFGKM